MVRSSNTQNDNLVSEHRIGSGLVPLCDKDVEETNEDVEIMEEGEEGEPAGPVLADVRGQPNLTLITYRIGHSRVIEAKLDKYVEQGLLKASHHDWCRALGREEVPRPERGTSHGAKLLEALAQHTC